MSTKSASLLCIGMISGILTASHILHTRDLEEFCGATLNVSVELDTESYTKGNVTIQCREHKYISEVVNISHRYNPATAKVMSIMATRDEDGKFGDGEGFSL